MDRVPPPPPVPSPSSRPWLTIAMVSIAAMVGAAVLLAAGIALGADLSDRGGERTTSPESLVTPDTVSAAATTTTTTTPTAAPKATETTPDAPPTTGVTLPTAGSSGDGPITTSGDGSPTRPGVSVPGAAGPGRADEQVAEPEASPGPQPGDVVSPLVEDPVQNQGRDLSPALEVTLEVTPTIAENDRFVCDIKTTSGRILAFPTGGTWPYEATLTWGAGEESGIAQMIQLAPGGFGVPLGPFEVSGMAPRPLDLRVRVTDATGVSVEAAASITIVPATTCLEL